ncbi:hypothetical protein COU61_00320 [Candidatus Pacearchaeota archaeon CG10_big_fil_rev_8_21_14_0_10_35_13]|nr:MAG: hypothetical protein COU61_00320 [Candidatus Pacearchaeota archaeon CG10_big_fil_rev_8_21_14_0_10_35_13]
MDGKQEVTRWQITKYSTQRFNDGSLELGFYDIHTTKGESRRASCHGRSIEELAKFCHGEVWGGNKLQGDFRRTLENHQFERVTGDYVETSLTREEFLEFLNHYDHLEQEKVNKIPF